MTATQAAFGEAGGQPPYMLSLPVDARRLFAFARDQGLLRRSAPGADGADTGYAVHALFAALFGALGPRPFSLDDRQGLVPRPGGRLRVLAYARAALPDLRRRAERFAEPDAYRAIGWEEAADKPMPAAFPDGLALAFEVRACPVTRLGRDSFGHRPGAEIDAYEAACLRAARALGAPDARLPAEAKPDRQAVYRDWLAARFAAAGAATLDPDSVRITALRSSRLFRRGRRDGGTGEARASKLFQRPDVVFAGRLRVADPAAFGAWLIRGVGRHCAFGFGMLLLRPAGGDAGA